MFKPFKTFRAFKSLKNRRMGLDSHLCLPATGKADRTVCERNEVSEAFSAAC
jgi:hypothetical protein